MKKYIALLALLCSGLVHADDVTVAGMQSLLNDSDPEMVGLANGYISGFRDGFVSTLETDDNFDAAYAFCSEQKIFHTDIIAARVIVQETGTENAYGLWFVWYVIQFCPELGAE